MSLVNDVVTCLKIEARITEVLVAMDDEQEKLKLETLVSDAGENLALNPNADVSQYALDIAAMLIRAEEKQ